MFTIDGKYTSALVTTNDIDKEAVAQIMQIVNHPSFTNKIVIMPDVHAGAGGPIGFTMELTDSIVCNIIGVDIGCGMLAYKLRGKPITNFEEIDRLIRQRIPFGTAVHQRSSQASHPLAEGDQFFTQTQAVLNSLWTKLRTKLGTKVPQPPQVSYNWYMSKCQEIGMDFERAQMSIGTLGGGNHFIEIGISRTPNPDPQLAQFDPYTENTWVIIHSGSRQFGEKVCKFHQAKAKRQADEFKKGNYQAEVNQLLRDTPPAQTQKELKKLKERYASKVKFPSGMEPLTGRAAYMYLYDMVFAQCYASHNREMMMSDIMKMVLKPAKKQTRPWHLVQPAESALERIETIHNFIDPEDLIIRKGAVPAREGEKIVIPFNMKDGTWICRGRGEPLWNQSAPHGAGRIMSRSQAKKTLKQEDADKQMEGIYTSCIPLDEAPDAYKPAGEIKNAIGPTAGVVEEITPVMNLKAK